MEGLTRDDTVAGTGKGTSGLWSWDPLAVQSLRSGLWENSTARRRRR